MFEDEDNKEFKNNYDPEYRQEEPKRKENPDGMGLAIFSMVLGILSLLFFIIGLNIISGIAAIVLGIISVATCSSSLAKKFSITGIVTAALSLVLFGFAWSFMLNNVDNLMVLEDDTEGLESIYELYGIGEDDFYDYLEEYPEFNQEDGFPFEDDEFDMDDTL
jgi:hypothetical protein